jgi:YidC/Oxa1 family membrane protein insertase
MPVDKDARKLRDILKAAGDGKQADQAEVNAAVGRSTQYIIPFMVFLFTVNLPAALSLYWLTGGVVALIQQSIALREDEADLEKLAEGGTKRKDVKQIAEAEIVAEAKPRPSAKKSPRKKSTKRRK